MTDTPRALTSTMPYSRDVFARAVATIRQYADEAGPCDHSTNICVCQLRVDADELEACAASVVSRAVEFEAVARNLGQVLQNTASWIEEWEQGGFSTRVLPDVVQPNYLRGVFAAQLAAHQLSED